MWRSSFSSFCPVYCEEQIIHTILQTTSRRRIQAVHVCTMSSGWKLQIQIPTMPRGSASYFMVVVRYGMSWCELFACVTIHKLTWQVCLDSTGVLSCSFNIRPLSSGVQSLFIIHLQYSHSFQQGSTWSGVSEIHEMKIYFQLWNMNCWLLLIAKWLTFSSFSLLTLLPITFTFASPNDTGWTGELYTNTHGQI